MKVKRELIILALIIASLTTYIILQKKGKTHYTLPEVKQIEEKDVSTIIISRGDRDIQVERKEDGWVILPGEFPADETIIQEMVVAAGLPALTALASESRSYAIYELDPARSIRVELKKGDRVLRNLEIGKTASSYRHTFVRFDDDHRVFHARGDLKTIFDRKSSDLRDRLVMMIDDDITEVTLQDGKRKLVVVKTAPPVPESGTAQEGEEEGTENGPPAEGKAGWQTEDGKPVKVRDMEEIIATLSNLRCESFIEDKKKEEFTDPIYTTSLKGAHTYSVSLFEKTGNTHAATSSESDYPFLLPEWIAKKIMRDPDTLLEEK